MTKPRKKRPLGQTIGGVLFGFEQQVLRTMPPAQEMVHHARPDDPLPAGDGGLVTIGMPADKEPALPSAPSVRVGVGPGSAPPALDPDPESGVDEP
jgi:hypothetical protein